MQCDGSQPVALNERILWDEERARHIGANRLDLTLELPLQVSDSELVFSMERQQLLPTNYQEHYV